MHCRLKRRNFKSVSITLIFTLLMSFFPAVGPPPALAAGEAYDFVKAWPAVVLSYPVGADVDANDNIYVADAYRNQIIRLDSSGNLLDTWGGNGLEGGGACKGNGQFLYPDDVSVDRTNGHVYVAEAGNGRIQKLDLNGNFIAAWSGPQTLSGADSSGSQSYYSGVAVDGTRGFVYATDSLSNRVEKYDLNGNFIAKWGGDGLGWGGSGQANGQFNYPGDIAIDAAGNVYVADTWNHRIQEFTGNGAWLATWGGNGPGWGGSGQGLGQFYGPQGVSIDANGDAYVVDTYNFRIQKRDTSTGNWSLVAAGYGVNVGQFMYPQGLALNSGGDILVADSSNDRLQKRDFLGVWSVIAKGSGSDPGRFDLPQGTAVDANGNVYVADTDNHRIQKFDAGGNWQATWGGNGPGWGGSGSAAGQFNQPQGVAVDSVGNVFVADKQNNRIQKRDASNGSWSEVGGGYGSAAGQFRYPHGVAVDPAGNVFVADTNNNRIQRFDASGNWQVTWGGNGPGWGGSGSAAGQFNQPQGVAVDPAGNVVVADTGNMRIQKRNGASWSVLGSGQGNQAGQFWFPRGVAVDSAGNIFVADTFNYRVQKFDAGGTWLGMWGRQGTADGYFDAPAGVAVGSNGHVYVADYNNHRIQEFQPGAPGASLTAPVQVSAVAASDSRIDLNWNDNSTGEDGFEIERKLSAGSNWARLGTAGRNQTSFFDVDSLQPATAYDYRVKAYSWWGDSPWSNLANATTNQATLKGHVSDQLGNPVAGAQVCAYGTTAYDPYWPSQTAIFTAAWASHWTLTDSNGNYTFTQQMLVPGDYKLKVVPPVGYFGEWYQDKSDYGTADVLTLSQASQQRDFTVELDVLPPTGNIALNSGAPTAYFEEVTLGVSGADNDPASPERMRFSNDGATWSNWEPYQAIKNWLLTSGSGQRTVWAQLKDRAGNVSNQLSDDIDLQPVASNIDFGANGLQSNGEQFVRITSSNRNFTIKVTVNCPNPNSVKMEVPINGVPTLLPLTYNSGSGQWEAQVTNASEGEIKLIVDCPSTGVVQGVIGRVRRWDPSGYVTDQATGLPIAGAVVKLYRLNPETALFEFVDPDVEDNSMLIDPAINPQITNAIGYYGWDVAPGTYYVAVHRDGYVDVDQSRVVVVPPPVTDLDIQMVDNLAPTAPALSGAAAGPTQIDLAWTPATDAGSGVAGYRIINADTSVPVAQTTETAFSLSGLDPGTSHNYYIKAFDAAGNESAPSNSVAITTPMPTNLALSGDTSGDYSDNAAVSAVLTDANGSPLLGKEVLFTLGTQEATAQTDALGRARASVKLSQTAGPKEISVDFAGDGYYLASQAQAPFEITKETLSINYTGDLITQRHQAPALKAKLAEGDASLGDLSGKPVVFTIGNEIATQTVVAATDGNGWASTTATIDLPAGVYKITAAFAGDGYYRSIETSPSTFVVWEPIAGLSAKGSGRITKAGVKKAEFGFNIKYPKTSPYPKGEFEYEEEFRDASGKEKDIELESTAINWLVVADGLAIFDGQAAFEHQSGVHTFRVFAVDNGKPGAGIDTFELYLDGLPFASGTLVKGDVIVK